MPRGWRRRHQPGWGTQDSPSLPSSEAGTCSWHGHGPLVPTLPGHHRHHHRHPSAPPASPAALPAPQSAAPPPATGWEGRKKNINDYYKELKRNCKCYFSCRWMIAGWMIDSWMDGSLSLQAVTPFQSLPPERCCHLVSAQKGFYWLTGGCTRTGY